MLTLEILVSRQALILTLGVWGQQNKTTGKDCAETGIILKMCVPRVKIGLSQFQFMLVRTCSLL